MSAVSAALRRWLLSTFNSNNNIIIPQTLLGKRLRSASNNNKTTISRRWKAVAAAGACGSAAYYYYHHHHLQSCEGGSGLKHVVEARLLPQHLPLPSVSAAAAATSKVVDEDGETHRSAHERRFYRFSSVELEGQLYMTPLNFIESVTMAQPKGSRSSWKSLTRKELEKMLADTPPVWKGSSNMFRNLRERGIISYTEYLFLLCILTKPLAGFKIAFNMLDNDGNQMVDKREFFLLEDIFRKKSDKKEAAVAEEDPESSDEQALQLYGPTGRGVPPDARDQLGAEPRAGEGRGMWDAVRRGASQVVFSDLSEHADENKTDTTLLVHFFGRKGKAELNFEDFYKFMDNLQTEVLEIEFLSYSKGLPIITEEDFAQILLRYTTVDNVDAYLENLRHTIQDEKGITFEEFRTFFQFLNNLEDFTIAMQMYNFANRSVGQEEFMRAVYVATGLRLSRHVVNTVFKIFDEDHDGQLGYKEFIGIMKDRLHRAERGHHMEEKFTSFKSCMKKQLSGK